MSQLNFTLAKTKTIAADGTITAASNAAPISVTSAAHGLETGDIVQIAGVVGNTAANGQHTVTKVDANTYTLDNSKGNAAYTSGGIASHLGWSTLGVNVDNTVFATRPDLTFFARAEKLSSGANYRIVIEDAADTLFVTRQPVAVFQGAGPVGTPLGASAVPQWEKSHAIKGYDVPDVRLAASGNTVRMRFYISGGAGKVAIFSGWITY